MTKSINAALEIVMEKFKQEYGEDAKMEEGDQIVTCFENATIILSLEKREIGINVILNKAFQSDYKLDVLVEDEAE